MTDMDVDRVELAIRVANECPFYKLVGMEVVEIKHGFARVRMPFHQKLAQMAGVAHGGAMASVADSAVAMALASLVGPEEAFTTVELKMNFLAPVSRGEVIAEATIIRKGSRIAVGDVDVKDGDGKLVGKCVATYVILNQGNKRAES